MNPKCSKSPFLTLVGSVHSYLPKSTSVKRTFAFLDTNSKSLQSSSLFSMLLCRLSKKGDSRFSATFCQRNTFCLGASHKVRETAAYCSRDKNEV